MQLSTELKQGTKESHNAAENGKFIAGFLRGVLDEEQYKKLLGNFYYIYSAMELRFDKLKDDPVLGDLYFPELHRKKALEKDLKYYYGPTWREHICPSPATQQYVHRIEEAPVLSLIGHHYTRYLGDLSGGQILKGIAKKALKTGQRVVDLVKEEGLLSDEQLAEILKPENMVAPLDLSSKIH